MTEVEKQSTTARDTLAQEINEEHRACEQAAATAVEHAIRCGELLLEAKKRKPHGGWMPWLEENFEGSQDLANKYMRVARNSERVMNLVDEGRPVSLRGALEEVKTVKKEERREERERKREEAAKWWREKERDVLPKFEAGELNVPLQMVVSHTYDFEERPEGIEEPLLCRVGRPAQLMGSGQIVEYTDRPDWSDEKRVWDMWEAFPLEPGDEDFLVRICRQPGEFDLTVTEDPEDLLEYDSLENPPTRELSWDGDRLLLPTGHWRAVLTRNTPWIWWEWDVIEAYSARKLRAAADPQYFEDNWLRSFRIGPVDYGHNSSRLAAEELEAALAADLEAVRRHRSGSYDLTDPLVVYELGEGMRMLDDHSRHNVDDYTRRSPEWRRFDAYCRHLREQGTHNAGRAPSTLTGA